MTTSDLNDEIDQLEKAVNWAEVYPRDPDSWANLRNKIRGLRQSADVLEERWQKSARQKAGSPSSLMLTSSPDWSPETLHRS